MKFDHLPLTTSRLVLRPYAPGDEAAIFDLFSNAAVMRYWSSPPWTDRDLAARMIAVTSQGLEAGEHLRLGLEHRHERTLIGQCVLFDFVMPSRRAEIGYSMLPGYWGQGFMHEALAVLIGYAFDQLDLNRIEADIDPRNEASARVLERHGFEREGFLRERWIVGDEVNDTAMYGLLRSDWAGSR